MSIQWRRRGDQFFGDDGAPLAGGYLQHLADGTNLPFDTWKDAALTIANPESIYLDASGRLQDSIYIAARGFTERVYDAGDILVYDVSANDGSEASGGGTSSNWWATPSAIGVLSSPLVIGPSDRIDYASVFSVTMMSGVIASTDMLAMLNGANTCAIMNASAPAEILQFMTRTLVSGSTYLCSPLIRAISGSMQAATVPSGTTIYFK